MNLAQDKFKLSRYNVSYFDGDVEYVWNTYSDALLKLDVKSQKYIRTFSHHHRIDDKSSEFSILKDNGFIIYEQLDELGRIMLHEKQELFSRYNDNLSLTIALGMGCNYSCSYCYEQASDQTFIMTEDVAIMVAEYVCKKMKCNPYLKSIHITWFGGEPLLYIDIIEIISMKVIEYTQQNSIKYTASVTTNGRFLDADAISKLQGFCVEHAQITLDGMCELYCISKGATPEDFHRVIENLLYAADKLRLSVRLNIPSNNVNEAITVADFLLSQHELLGKVSVYFAFLIDYSLSPNDARQAYINYTHNYSVWADYIMGRYGISELKGLKHNRRRITFCGLIQTENICIGPRGELYRCQHDFGVNSKKTGDVWRGSYYNEAEFEYYSTIDSPQKHECCQCDFLPICMGRCMNHSISGYAGFDCKAFKQLQFKLKRLEGGVQKPREKTLLTL